MKLGTLVDPEKQSFMCENDGRLYFRVTSVKFEGMLESNYVYFVLLFTCFSLNSPVYTPILRTMHGSHSFYWCTMY